MKRLELYYPLKPFTIFQPFAANDACIPDTPDVPAAKRRPVVSKVNSVCPAGFVELYPLLGMTKGHTGVDLIATGGQPIYASVDGFVYELNTEPERGLGVDVITRERFSMDDAGEHFAKYRNFHMKSLVVSKGQDVNAGDLLGEADTTGISSGNHDHYELKPVEPALSPKGAYYNVLQNNGWFGSVDPAPFFNGKYAEDLQYHQFTHYFAVDLGLGDEGPEVKALQRALKIEGMFPPLQEETGFYGNITLLAVKEFQKKYQIATWGTPGTTGFGRVGPKTRKKLNELYA